MNLVFLYVMNQITPQRHLIAMPGMDEVQVIMSWNSSRASINLSVTTSQSS